MKSPTHYMPVILDAGATAIPACAKIAYGDWIISVSTMFDSGQHFAIHPIRDPNDFQEFATLADCISYIVNHSPL